MEDMNGYRIFCIRDGYLTRTKIWNGRKFKTKIQMWYNLPDDTALVKENRIMVNPNTFRLLKNALPENLEKVLSHIKYSIQV